MAGAQDARLWMLLKTERSLGLESVRWKLAKPPASSPVARSPGAADRPLPPRPMPAARSWSAPRPAESAPPAANRPAMLPTPAPPVTSISPMPEFSKDARDLPVTQRTEKLKVLNDTQVRSCTKCLLSQGRTQTVFGEGAVDAQLMFIGEGPGETEDQTGRPFVGRAGQLLTKMIAAMGLEREQVYIANVVKCRPPGNRTPTPDEVATCTPYLVEQIQTIRPKVIVTLGLPASQFLLASTLPMGQLRGKWHDWRGIKVMPTYHPSYVLRSYTPEVRGKVWSDLQMVMAELGLKGKMAQLSK